MRAFKELVKIVTDTAELTDVYGVARREDVGTSMSQ